ncbi:hypothetical protein DPMN_032964 [Dreissena polymorpha]|uniref:Uncharacterized protein n=1 Tax=Dreissena polymorpha TaxID=45954 RepID=A0A9D4M543_DREPO|nr:hypothetical protein DPMN_032964 [Dreissena polymorpha]
MMSNNAKTDLEKNCIENQEDNSCSIFNANISIAEKRKAVLNCKNGKECGADLLPYEVFKNEFDKCFITGITPSLWSIAHPLSQHRKAAQATAVYRSTTVE